MSASLNRFARLIALSFLLAVPVWLARTAVAQTPEQAAANGVESSTVEDDGNLTFRLTVSPAAEPRPALQYRFLVPPVDQIHANAATFYYKAMVMDGHDWLARWDADEQVGSWSEMPIEALPIQEMKRRIGPAESDEFNAALTEGARADYCNWEDPIRQFGVQTLLPQAQKLRSLARALAIIARLQIAEHRYGDAIATLRLGYALSRNMGHSPSLVQSLIGRAIEGVLNGQTRTLIGRSDSPNLYWALTELAGRPVEMRQALSYETHVWEFTIHKLTDLEQRTLSPREALDLLKDLYETESLMGTGPVARHGEWGCGQELAAVSAALAIEPAARAYLVEHGKTAAEVDAMPILQRAILYRWLQYAEARDDFFKWPLLPDDEKNQQTSRFEAQNLLALPAGFGSPFVEALPAVGVAFDSALRRKRDLDLLRTVEALRMHAAQHGTWPQSLADVTAVPIPVDPFTRKPFEYSVATGVATLNAPRTSQSAIGLRYELTLRQPAPAK
jgi:hypothetical protein